MITFPVYQKIGDEPGPSFQCAVYENGHSRLIFGGATAAEAEGRAKEWAFSKLDTPERRAKIAERAAAAAARRKEKVQSGSIFE